MGAVHLSAFSKIPSFHIAAISTRNEGVAQGDLSHIGGNVPGAAKQIDIRGIKVYRRWEELIEDSALEAVDVCAPSDLHAEIVLAALRAGKHVFCEKPMALTPADCSRMLVASQEAGRVLMVGHVLRFWPEYEWLRNAVKSERYGRVLSATFTRRCGLPDWSTWIPDVIRSGGPVLDLLIHDIDQAVLLFGAPERVAAKKLGDEDAMTATLIYNRGPEVRIQGGWFAPGTPFSMGFQVRMERAEIEFASGSLRLKDGSGSVQKIELSEVNAYEAELAYFGACCLAGSRPSRCPPEESALAVKLATLLGESRQREGEQITCSD
jgi:predicted dehydrogenase